MFSFQLICLDDTMMWVLDFYSILCCFFANFGFLPRNRLTTMKACQAAQPILYMFFFRFSDDSPSDKEGPPDGANWNSAF